MTKDCIRHTIILTLLFILSSYCSKAQENETKIPNLSFSIEVLNRYTPVKHQGYSSNCWAFSTLSMLESEMLRLGVDSVSLSYDYVYRGKLIDQSLHYYRMAGHEEFRKGSLPHSCFNVVKNYGIVPLSTYQQKKVNYSELRFTLELSLKDYVKKGIGYDKVTEGITAIVDKALGKKPETFRYNNKDFTPESFANHLQLNMDNYIEITNSPFQPYNKRCHLDSPDNWEDYDMLNLELDVLLNLAKKAIREGYTFVWDGDVSNEGYAPEYGLAFYPKRSSMTTKKRAKLLETFETTDDHAMHAIGLAYDQYGKTYFIIKDSYGVRGPYRGLLMMSEDYFKANTICIALHRNALKLIDD